MTHLTFEYFFNQPLNKDDIPKSVTHLIFGYHFNQPLKKDDIPNSVTHLIFGHDFNQHLDKNVISNSVTHLTFGENFNQPLEKNVIPKSVTNLTFGYKFNQNLDDNNLPKSIIEILFFGNKPYSLLKSKDRLTGNILYNGYNYNYHYNDNLIICGIDKNLFDEKILVFTPDKFIGNTILRELTEKVFHPNRLLKLCDKYNIGFYELMDIY